MRTFAYITLLAMACVLPACAGESEPVGEESELRAAPIAAVYDCDMPNAGQIAAPRLPQSVVVAPSGSKAQLEITHVTDRRADRDGRFTGKYGKPETELQATAASDGTKLVVTAAKNVITIDRATRRPGTWGGQAHDATITEAGATYPLRCTAQSTKDWLRITALNTGEVDGQRIDLAAAPAELAASLKAATADIDRAAEADGVPLEDTRGIFEIRFVTGGDVAGYAVWAQQEVDDVHEEGHNMVYLVAFDAKGKELLREMSWIP